MSDDLTPDPEPPPSEPRYRIEADTWEELLRQLQLIAPESGDLRFLAPRKEHPHPPDRIEPPPRASHKDLKALADELTLRLHETAPGAAEIEDEPPHLDRSDWHPHRRSVPGAVLRRHNIRRSRWMESEAGYVWLHDAMLARELDDRNEAVDQLEQVRDAARLERLAEHSPHRVTRRAALDALARLDAVPALESAALYVRPEVFTPKKPKAPAVEGEGAPIKEPEFHDDTRDHAVDLLAQLADRGRDDALGALLRIVRYDFSRDTAARLRALRRLGERLDRLEARRDWEGLALLYRESRNAALHRDVAGRLARYLPDLEASGAVDALLAVADHHPELQEPAEAAVRRLEGATDMPDAGAGGGEADRERGR